MLIPDRDNTAPFYTDVEVEAFLSLEGGNVRRATALALETMASDQVMVLKVIRTMDLSTDGAKTAAEMRARATGLRKQADDAETYEEGGAFDWAEMVLTPFNAYERDVAELLRESY